MTVNEVGLLIIGGWLSVIALAWANIQWKLFERLGDWFSEHIWAAPEAGSPPQCEREIYERGVWVATIADRSAKEIEQLIIECRHATGERVDWHYIGGRGVVKALGNVVAVKNYLRQHAGPWFHVNE